jgi:hypothetical protein
MLFIILYEHSKKPTTKVKICSGTRVSTTDATEITSWSEERTFKLKNREIKMAT